MAKKRMNIETIAEILINEIEGMKSTSVEIGTASEKIREAIKTPVEVDTGKLDELLGQRQAELMGILKEQSEMHRTLLQSQETHLKRFKGLLEKKHSRVPNWAIAFLFACFLASTGTVWYSLRKVESYKYEKARADHFEGKYKKASGKQGK